MKVKEFKSKEKDKFLEKIYDDLFDKFGGAWYILELKDIDKLYEDIMVYAKVYDRETGKFVGGDDWSDDAHKLSDIIWHWWIEIIHKKLRITRYYEKYYGDGLNESKD